MTWIACKDLMPKEGELVLFCDHMYTKSIDPKRYVTLGYFENTQLGMRWLEKNQFTYWTLIPELPLLAP